MLEHNKTVSQMRFAGAAQVEPIADQQIGPTCGFEALENLIQLFYPTDNNFAQRELLPLARDAGCLVRGSDGDSLALKGYQPLLAHFGITARWYPLDHQQVLIPALHANRGVLAIGPGYALNPNVYAPNGIHAIVITNYYTDEPALQVLGYVGIDSNFPNQQTLWPWQAIEASLTWAQRYYLRLPLLITDAPIRWPSIARYYRLLRSGHLESVA